MANEFGLRDYLEAKFDGIDQRFDAQDDRLDLIEKAGPRAGAFGAAGTFVGALVVIIASALGIKPPSQQ